MPDLMPDLSNITTVELEVDALRVIDALTDEIPAHDILRAIATAYGNAGDEPRLQKLYQLILDCADACEALESVEAES